MPPFRPRPVPFAAPLLDTRLNGTVPDRHGKVRDLFDLGDRLLLVATDRISAFDYVLGSGIPDKGKVLTQLSAFWFEHTASIVPNHVLSTDMDDLPAAFQATPVGARRALDAGPQDAAAAPSSAWPAGICRDRGGRNTRPAGAVCGVPLPAGLRESDRLPRAIFTPATKASTGHDINISEAEAGALIGESLVARVRDLTLALYAAGAAHAESRGIILADTKFEFGVTDAGELILIDEVMTPDSSRYWPMDQYAPGGPQPSFDKQFVRDYLERIHWNKQPPVPSLPEDVVVRTRDKYLEAFRRLTGRELD